MKRSNAVAPTAIIFALFRSCTIVAGDGGADEDE
jgi:hypothetical protein